MLKFLLSLPERLFMFVDQIAAALLLEYRGDHVGAEHATWVGCFWMAHGRYPSNDEYKEYSIRKRDERNRDRH